MPKEPPLILLVDDEADVLSVYKRKLELSGFNVITATNGAEAVQQAAIEEPDLILMDMKMPIMNGLEAWQKIRENPLTKNIKVIFLTAFGDPLEPEIDEHLAKEIGAKDFIRKGIDLDELVSRVKKSL
jgi:CheY-like chemotaxis protein